MKQAVIRTPLGFASIRGDKNGIEAITVADDYNFTLDPVIPEILQDAVYQLEEYFSGKRKTFSVALNPRGSEFQKKVWKELLTIPYGKTISYLELSRQIGDEKAIRAVAGANAKNPLWVMIPCHRVIGSDGSLVGYAGGLWRKKWLIEHENPPSQLTMF